MESIQRKWADLDWAAWRPVVPLLVIQFLSGVWFMPQFSFFPVYLDERLALLPVVIAAFVSVGQLAGMMSGILGGVLSDARGSKWVLLVGLACAAVSALTFRVTGPAVVLALWFIGGLALGFHTLGGQSYITRVAEPRMLGLASALYALALTLGGAAGSPIAGRVLDAQGFGVFALLASGAALTTLVLTAVWLPPVPAERGGEQRSAGESWAGAIELAQRPTVLMLVVLRFLPTIFYAMLGVLIPVLINRVTGSKTTVATYVSVMLVVSSGAQLLAGRAADRFGPRVPALISFSAMILSAFGLALTADTLPGLFFFGVTGNAAAWAMAALMFVLVSDGVARPEHGRVFGLLHGAWSIAMISGALLGGALVRVGPGLPFLIAGLINIGSIFLVLAYLRRVSGPPAPA
jgi:MFS family permease